MAQNGDGAPAALELNNVGKTFVIGDARASAVKGLDLAVQRGEFLTLLGPSGCGKSTTLRMIAGLEDPDSGEIRIAGELVYSSGRRINIPTYRRDISMVFQGYALWPHMTVRDNVGFPLRVGKAPKKERESRVAEALSMVGLDEFGDRPPTALSGGQQQRVAVARAVVKGARLVLLDEPLSNLDARLRAEMRAELRELQRRLGLTTVYVTHDQDEALTMSDRIAVMRDGNLLETATPEELYLRPRTLFGAQVVGQSHVWDGRIESREGSMVRIRTALGSFISETSSGGDAAPGTSASLVIRPEQIRLVETAASPSESRTQNEVSGTVEAREFGGKVTRYRVRVMDEVFAVEDFMPVRFGVGDAVTVSLPPDRCWVLCE